MAQDLQEFTSAVKAGKIVVINSNKHRLWCCSARDEKQISSLKYHSNIPQNEGINIWVDSDSRLNQHFREIPDAAWDLFDATEGEITILLPNPNNIASASLFSDNYAAITFCKEQWASKMMQWLKSPLAVLKTMDDNESIPSNLQGDVYVLNLPSEINPSLAKGFSIIKLSSLGDIEIIRSQGQKIAPHI